MRKWWKRVEIEGKTIGSTQIWVRFISNLFILFFFSMLFSATKQILCNTNFLFYLILEEFFWCGVLCWCMVWRSLLMWRSVMIDDSESEVRVRATRETERRREKNIKIHGYCSICAFMHNFTPLDVSFFFFFISKCVKWRNFCILEDFASIDVDALRLWIFYSSIKNNIPHVKNNKQSHK